MKKLILTSSYLLLCTAILFGAGADKRNQSQQNDTSSFVEIEGKIVDSKTAAPIVFASAVVTGTSISTVSNNDGEFILKVPKSKSTGSISFTHLGYENAVVAIAELNGGKNHIKLKAVSVLIDEVVIRKIDPKNLIIAALDKVKDNYNTNPEMQTGFYRETVRQNKKYVAVAEAVVDMYRSGYRTSFDSDRMKIYKGRKSQDVKKMDTLLVKLQGGPRTSLLLDLVKNPGDLLDPEMLDYYEFKLSGIISIDNRETYVVSFDQLPGVEMPLYKGNAYIDAETNAFAGFDFALSERGIKYASEVLVRKKPSDLNVTINNAHYLVRFRKDTESWCLNYVRSELDMTTKWKRNLFKSDYALMLEMAVTDRDLQQIEKFTGKESVKMDDVFTDQVSSFEDPNFWGDYNTIKPDESIEVAIEKLNTKLKRRN
ncbi:MAG: carboxypeptidase-like regulatory domain-containing protein [Bacteroidota bacterium]|nr:MAG: carboxypeptidase-like regulatory domain-containing protein [Bacteroidota bacterium]